MNRPGAARPGRAARYVALCLAVMSWTAAADEPPAAPDDFAEIGARDGMSMGFGLLRLGGDDPGQPLGLKGHALTGPVHTATRVLVDERSGSAFGYHLDAQSLSRGPLVLKLDVTRLKDEKDLKRLPACATCPPLRLVDSSSIRLPPTRMVREGDVVVIALLVRPDTGEKIVDVVKLSSQAVTRAAIDGVRGRIRQAFGLIRRGDELIARGALEAAAAAYRQALALQVDPAVHARLGQCYQRLERPGLAQQEYQKAVQLDPSDAESWLSLAVLLHRGDSYGKAVGAYRRAVDIRGDWALARRNLATALLDRGDFEGAFQEYRRARRAAPDILRTTDPASVKALDAATQHYLFARVHAAEGDVEAALASLQSAKDAGFKALERVQREAEFQPLLQDPRLVGLIAGRPRS